MFSSIFSVVASGLKILATALGWIKQTSDQNIGRQLQAAADAQATIKEDADAQKIATAVSAMSDADLDNELRQRPASTK